VRLDEDEIDIPGAEPISENRPATRSPHVDGQSLSISAHERSITRTRAVIGWMSVKPEGELEGMLAAQMVATHMAANDLHTSALS
jgi:hypothetical protein